MLKRIKATLDNMRVRLRELTNPLLSSFRRKKLKNTRFTIISNNCWGGHVYRYFGIPYLSPTIGLYFYSDDYVKFCDNLKYYIQQPLRFIDREDSKHRESLIAGNKTCPIGILDDVEIVFLHYKNKDEALEKWNRRKSRIVWDNIVFKMSEQNFCKPEHIKEFSRLKERRKFCFVTNNYGYNSDVLWGG